MSDNARERAKAVIYEIVRFMTSTRNGRGVNEDESIAIVATALERERREAEQAQLDRDCAIVLRAPELYGDEHDARLRRAYAERLRDDPKATP